MARSKILVDLAELQAAIHEVEAVSLFNSPHKLYEAVAQTEWAQARGLTATVLYSRIRQANADPNNPQVVMRTRPARTPKRAVPVAINGIEVVVAVFRARGIEVTDASCLMTSAHKTREENRAVLLAWADLRDEFDCPKPGSVVTAAPAPAALGELPAGNGEASALPGVEVIEEYPDGAPVIVEAVVELPVEEPLIFSPPVAVPIAGALVPALAPAPISVAVTVLPGYTEETVNTLKCTECEFACNDLDEADQHEADNPGHLVNVG